MNTIGKLRQMIERAVDGVLESSCALCDRSTSEVCCLDCWRQVQSCRLSLSQGLEQVCLMTETEPVPLLAWGAYQGSLKRAIAALKYEQGQYGLKSALGRLLGHELGRMWLQTKAIDTQPSRGAIAVVPIPLHPDKQAQRGYNQAELIAAGFCEMTRLPLRPGALTRTRATQAQFGLSVAEREQNLAGAFRVNRTSLGRSLLTRVILVDDIYTTGATIRSAAAILEQHYISIAGVAAVARPYRHSQRGS